MKNPQPAADCDEDFILSAMDDAVSAMCETFTRQFGVDLTPAGEVGLPQPDGVEYGSTIALVSADEKIQFGCVFPAATAQDLTRILFCLEDDEEPTLEDLGDAMREIPNVAAGLWKAKREAHAENYQLGLPLFIRGASWIRFFPRGVRTLAQTLTGPDGIRFQVVFSWQPQTEAEGVIEMSETQQVEALEAPTPFTPEVLQEAVEAVVRTCRIQMDLDLEVVSEPRDPREAAVEFGSSIALTTRGGSWQLAVMCNRPGGMNLTRALFAMEPDEAPEMEDMADALGEIANVAAGVLKASRTAAGQQIQLGLPLFMEGKSCFEFFADGVQGMAQAVQGPDGLEAHVVLIWQEG